MPTVPPLVLLVSLIYTGKVRVLQEPARIILTLSLPGLSFIFGILEGNYKEKLVGCRCLYVW